MKSTIFLSLSIFTLAGCSDPVNNDTDIPAVQETAMPVEPDGGIGDGAGPVSETPPGVIPAAMYGRWGLVSGDCTDERGDAKGAMTVSERELRFYESRAALGDVASRDERSIRATYAFVGEGQEWSREIELRLGEGDNTITRSEYGEDALAEPLTYTRCPF